MRSVKDLSFYQKPDYKSLLNIFAEELKIKKFKIEDDCWDWDIQRYKIIKMKIQQEEIEKQQKILAQQKSKKGKDKQSMKK